MTRELTPADLVRTPVLRDSKHKPGMRAAPKIVAVTLPVRKPELDRTPAVTL